VWLVRRFEQLIARGAVHQAPSRRRALQSLGRQSILSRSIADYPEMALYGGKPEGMIIAHIRRMACDLAPTLLRQTGSGKPVAPAAEWMGLRAGECDA
jgi:hypothetical protein